MSLEKWLLTVQPSTGVDVESLYMFGDNTWGQLGTEDRTFKSSPALIGAQSWSQIASGLSHTIGIRSDGKLFAWGANTYGQLGNNDVTLVHRSSPVQLGINNWSKVSANGDTSYAIDYNGLIYAWGLGFNGQLGNNSMSSVWGEPSSWTQVLTGINSIAIKSNGTLWAWGRNGEGQLGDNTLISRSSPVQIGTSSWIALGGAAGTSSGRFGVRNDNLLFVWGNVSQGQSGNNNTTQLSSPTLTGSLSTSQIQKSYTSSIAIAQRSWTTVAYNQIGSLFAIRNDGVLFAWGSNSHGELGLNDRIHRSSPVQIGTSSWTSISVNGNMGSYGTALALRADNTLWSWGGNTFGELGLNNILHRSSPVQIGTGTWSKLIQNGGIPSPNSAAIDSNQKLWSWGNNTGGLLGLGDQVHRSSPVQVGTSNWLMVSAGTDMMAGITVSGALFAWGSNTNGQLGINSTISRSSPVLIGIDSWAMITSGKNMTMGITTGGELYTWGHGTYIGDGYGISRSSPVQITALTTSPLTVSYNSYLTTIGSTGTSWVYINGGSANKLAIRNDGKLFAWGSNGYGQLGINSTNDRSSPVQIGTSSWTTAILGNGSTFAIRNDGSLWTWGDNTYGQLGLNDKVHRSSPVQVGTDYNWTHVNGGFQALAIKNNGSLWAWGYNGLGSLGLNDTNWRSSPVQVGTSSWIMVSAIGSQSLAIRNDGSLWTWGDNTYGQLGLNDKVYRSSPVQVGTSSWTMINSYLNASSGITSDNRLFTWGDNTYGQLGLNDIVSRSSPVQIGTNLWSQVNGGYPAMYGRRIDGSLWAWGYNGQSELGANIAQTINVSSPVSIGGANSWNMVGGFAAAIDSNGMLWSWGLGQYVGEGNSISRSSPVFIISGKDSWTYVSAGDDLYSAIRSDGLLFKWGLYNNGANGRSVPGTTTIPQQITTSSWSLVPGGGSTSVGIDSSGQLFTWGTGTNGQLGENNTTHRSSPVFIRSMNDSWTGIGIGTPNSLHIAGIRNDNTLWLWGQGDSGVLGDSNIISKSQPIQLGKDLLSWTYLSGSSTPVDGTQTAAGIRSNGSLWTWGSNTYGQLGTNNLVHRSSPVQVGTSSWTALSAGRGFLFAIRSDRTLWSWGSDNSVGALGANTTAVLRSSPVQVGTSLWNVISAGNLTPVGITVDGRLFAWGANTIGQVGDNTVVARSSPVQIGNLFWTSAVAGLDSSSYGIRLDGTLWSWGDNAVGELGEDDTVHRSSPVQIGTGKWKKLAAGFSNAFSIDINNKLWSWGDNSTGQLGINDTTNRSSPVQIGTSSWLMVSSSQSGNIVSAYVVSAIRSDGALFAWGNNTYGGLGDTTTVNKSSPVQIGTSSWTMVAGRMGIIQDNSNGNGYIYAWGGNTVGELGINSVVNTSSPVQVNATTHNWYQVTQGVNFTLAIHDNKTLWSWGNNTGGQLGLGDQVHRSSPVQIGASSWSQVSAGVNHVLALDNNNVLYGWGNNANGQLGTNGSGGIFENPVIITSLFTLADEIAWSTSTGKPRTLSWTKVSAGYSNSFAIRSDSKLFAWGLNTTGQLGLNDIIHRSSPVQVGTSNWSGIAAGVSHTYAIRSDGLLFIWGSNTNGQLGLNDLVHRSSPVQIGSSSWSFVPSIGGIATSTFAITLDGKLYGWGLNNYGQLGVNDIIARSSPVQVGTGNSWTLVSAEINTTLAIRTDSKLFAWGYGGASQLGDGTTQHRSSPVQIGTSNWTTVAVGVNATATGAIRSDGALFTWGQQSGGALGDSSINARTSPVQIVSFTSPAEQQAYLTKTGKTGYSWSTVVTNQDTTFAIRNDGLLFAWGQGFYGGLGLNDVQSRSSPVQVGTSSWLTVATFERTTAAIRSDGTLWSWGSNDSGQLGLNDRIHRSSPTQIGASIWTAVATGPNYYASGGTILGVRNDGTLWSWGFNDLGQLGLNDRIHRSSPVQIGTENTWSKVYFAGNVSTAIRTTGALYAWGVNTFGQLGDGTTQHRSNPVQIGTSSWTQVASGASWTVAIRSGGSLFTWGAGTNGVLGTPDSTQHRSSPVQIGTSSWSVVTASTITAGISNNLLYMWGLGTAGQMGDSLGATYYYSPTLTTGTGSWTTVNAGTAITALDQNRQLFTWGSNSNGQMGNGFLVSRSSPVFIRSVADSWTTIGLIVMGFLAIRSDGLLFAWGNNTYGTFGDGTNTSKLTPLQIGSTSWTMVTGLTNVLGITAADTGNALFTWGNGTIGELGTLNLTSRSSPVFIRSMNDSWISVGAGMSMSTAVRSDGKLFTWGFNTGGQLGLGDQVHRSTPVLVGTSNWVVVNAGAGTVGGITTDGRAYFWGANDYGQLGIPFNPVTISGSWLEPRSSPVQLGATPYINSPTQIGASSWSQVSAGVNHVLALTSTNQLFGWGNNSSYQVDNSGSNRSSPTQIGSSSWSQISAGNVHSLAIASDNSLYGWGLQYQPWVYDSLQTLTNYLLTNDITSSWTSLTNESSKFTGIKSDGTLWTWGLNNIGQLGLNDIFNRSSPVQVGTSSWSMVNTAESWTTAIRSDGTLWAWGLNTNGNLGLNDRIHRSSPTQIGTDNSWTIVGGNGAIRNDGSLWTWGTNLYGQLGINAPTSGFNRSSPVQVGTSSWIMIDSRWSSYGVSAIKSDGTLWAWGNNTNGQLGIGSNSNNISSPVQVTSITTLEQQNTYLTNTGSSTYSWTSISANGTSGAVTTGAIRSDGALFMWGLGFWGGLGDTTTVNKSSPVQIGTSSWTQVSVGAEEFAYAVRIDGTLWTWGLNNIGQLGLNDTINRSSPVQIGTSSWTIVAAGQYCVSAIRSDGALFSWGNNNIGQLGLNDIIHRSSPVQVGTSSWTQVRANNGATAALSINGILFTWGSNADGKLGLNDRIHRSSPTQIGTSSWTQVSVGQSAMAAISSNNNLWTWGLNTTGQLGLNDIFNRSSPVQVGTSSWTSVASGVLQTLAIRSDNTLWAWGSNTNGQLGLNDRIHRSSPVQVGTSSWFNINGLADHIVAIENTSKQLFSWGNNNIGQLGLNDSINRSSPVFIRTANDSWNQISMQGLYASAAIRSDGLLFTWGANSSGQLGNNTVFSRSIPVQVGISSWSQISVGTLFMVGRTSNKLLYAWGSNTAGQLGLNDTVNRSTPTLISTSSWSFISAGSTSTIGTHDGNILLYGWGDNNSGQLGLNDMLHRSSPVQIASYVSMPKKIGTDAWSKISAGYYHNVGIQTNNKLYGWGNTAANTFTAYSWTKATASAGHVAAIRSDGLLFTWGDNDDGNLGSNNTLHRSIPIQVGTSSWTQISAGGITTTTDLTTFGISSDNLLYGWGAGGSGQLGLGTIANRSSPVQISTFTTEQIQQTYLTNTGKTGFSWTQISASGNLGTLAAIRNDGALFIWGLNNYGQLGLNSITAVYSPVQVGTSSWTQVSVGNGATYAIRIDNTLWSWGANVNGQLGLNDREHRSSPVQVGTSSWTMISGGTGSTNAGTGIAAALRIDGALFSWGNNATGQLGLNDTINRSSPVQVGTSSWSQISAGSPDGSTNMYGIRLDGTLWSWGDAASGALGQNQSGIPRSSPVQVGTDTNWQQVSSGAGYFMAIKTTGSLWACGFGVFGALGTGNSSSALVPVQVGTSSWTSVSAGSAWSTSAIKADNTLWAWGLNTNGQLGLNDTVHRSSPVQIGTSTWSKVSSGTNPGVIMAISFTNKQLYIWGQNSSGQLGLGETIGARSSPMFVRSVTESWNAISAGAATTIGIRSDNTLWAWGLGTNGQLGDNTIISKSVPIQIGTSSWSQVSAGNSYNTALTVDKRLFVWGLGTTGQIGDNAQLSRSSPVQIGASWTMVSAGGSTVGAINSNNLLFTWGGNSNGQLGDRSVIHRSSPVQVNSFTSAQIQQTYLTNTSKPAAFSWSQVNINSLTSAAIRSDGALFMWGQNNSGELGLNDLVHRSSPVQVGTSSWTQVSVGTSSMAAIRSDGTLWSWGDNAVGQLGLGDSVNRSSPVQVGTSSWIAVASTLGLATFLALDATNRLFAWGANTNGELAQNNVISRNSPVQIATGSTWLSISNRGRGAIRSDGALFMWGLGTNGQIGDNAQLSRSSPVQIGSSSWSVISAGWSHAAAITSTGLLYVWGGNNSGELGLNDISWRSSPVQLGAFSWTSVSSGFNHTAGIRSDKLLFAWGLNSNGQIGDANTSNRSSPVQIGTSSWAMVSAGRDSTTGLDLLYGLYTWGRNNTGQLGIYSVLPALSPVFLPTTSDSWTNISTQNGYQLGIRSDGYLFGWGINASGQLGLGDQVPRSAPVQIGTYVSPILYVSNNASQGLIIVDGKMATWGLNNSGQLGVNDRISRSSPVQIGNNQSLVPPNMYSIPTQIGSSSWTQVSANFNNTLLVDPNNVLYEWGFNDNRPIRPIITAVGISAGTVSNGYNHFGITK